MPEGIGYPDSHNSHEGNSHPKGKGKMPTLKSMGMTPDELMTLVQAHGMKQKKQYQDDVKYAKEDLARAVFRLHEAKEKAQEMGKKE